MAHWMLCVMTLWDLNNKYLRWNGVWKKFFYSVVVNCIASRRNVYECSVLCRECIEMISEFKSIKWIIVVIGLERGHNLSFSIQTKMPFLWFYHRYRSVIIYCFDTIYKMYYYSLK